MKKGLIACLTALFLVACSPGGQNTDQMSSLGSDSIDVVSGEPLSEEVFTDRTVTMVNFWGTFCPPCIEEMPDLGAMSRELDDEDFRLVGVVLDVSGPEDKEGAALAQEIIQQAQADFTHIYVNKDVVERYGSPRAVPTTIFLNAEGDVIGDPIVGAASKEEYTRIVMEHLEAEAA